jgi:HSP20 family molecular chaperone IbpA
MTDEPIRQGKPPPGRHRGRETLMKTTAWLTGHDLSLTFDSQGRFWRFRPSASAPGSQSVDAHLAATDIVVTVAVPGVLPGDLDVQIRGDVLEIRGIAPSTGALTYDVGLPLHADMNTVETVYGDGVFEVHVPLRAAVETPSAELAPVAA